MDRLPLDNRWTALDKLPPPHRLYLRQSYFGWLYGGPRGWRWAGVQQPLDNRRPPPRHPDLESGPLKLKDGVIDADLDYLIVGSGPAGSVLGHELSRNGKRVLIVERGSFVMPGDIDPRLYPELKVGGGAVPTRLSSILVRNGQTVGGGSTVNVDLAFAPTLPFVRDRFEAWRKAGLLPRDQWTIGEVEEAYQWVVETIGTRTPTAEEINANNDILRRGAEAVGLVPRLYDLNTLPGRGPANDKLSATSQLLLPAMTRKENPLMVLPDFEVRTLQLEDSRAVGVVGRFRPPWQHPNVWKDPNKLGHREKETYQIRARNIILSAGAQGTAAILLRSGVGGDRVGKGVVLHPSMPLIGLFPEEIRAHEGTASTIYCVDPPNLLFECMTGDPMYAALMLDGTGEEVGERVRQFKHLGGFGVLLVDQPVEGNRIMLDDNGEPEVVYQLTESDKSALSNGVRRSLQIMLAAGAREVYLPSSEELLAGEADGHLTTISNEKEALEVASRLQFIPGATIVTSAHMQSTCKLGTSPDTSVVGADLKVWGFENLYVCDSSVFPTSVGANPMQAIYTVAKMTADRLVKPATGSR
ncbi:MAG: GMC family oxidoreductase [Candidatus Eremiobacteraeota bacterium]|nr:GMC family oxidoreductase [Candidatus Eremiobacteraeota bacterium]